MPELNIASPYIHSRVVFNTCTMGNPMKAASANWKKRANLEFGLASARRRPKTLVIRVIFAIGGSEFVNHVLKSRATILKFNIYWSLTYN
jgi:hypothetical protein